jgi:cell division GTPase FtsZ
MDKKDEGYARINVRQIIEDEIKKCCTYRFPKGIKMKDYMLNKDENSKKFCVIGIGGGGINIVNSIAKESSKYFILNAHIDHQELYESNVKNKLYIMSDIDDREILTVENRRVLSEFVSAHREVYVVTTFGRETHSSEVVDNMLQHLRHIGRKVILIVVKPFLFEVVPGRIRAINETIKKMESYVEKIFVFHNEDLLALNEVSNMSMSETFLYANSIIQNVIEENYQCSDEVVTNIYLKDFLNEQRE